MCLVYTTRKKTDCWLCLDCQFHVFIEMSHYFQLVKYISPSFFSIIEISMLDLPNIESLSLWGTFICVSIYNGSPSWYARACNDVAGIWLRRCFVSSWQYFVHNLGLFFVSICAIFVNQWQTLVSRDSGCSSVGRDAASDTRDLGSNPGICKFYLQSSIRNQCWKDKNKEKEVTNGPI